MRLLLAALLVAATLGGCLDEAEPNHDEDHGLLVPEDAMAADNATSNATVNTAPAAVLTASSTNVTLPANVTFNVTFEDAEGDDLTWTLDVDGDGAADTEALAIASDGVYAPFNFTFTYDDEGSYNVTLNVTDGLDAVAQTLVIDVAYPDEVADGVASQEVSGSWVAGTVLVGCFGDILGVGYPAPFDGVLYSSFAIEPGTIGRPYEVAITATGEQDSPGFTFLDESGAVVGGGFLSDAAVGDVPANAATGVFWTCVGAGMSGSYIAG